MDQRATERLDVGGTVLCRIGNAETRSQVRDMSVRGCKLVGVPGPLAKGAQIELTLLSGIEASGIIRWAGDGAVGVEFASEVNMAAVRYFTLAAGGVLRDDTPIDAFGRKLPRLESLSFGLT